MRRVEICGFYESVEIFTDADAERELAEEWAEVSTMRTELQWGEQQKK